MTKGYDARGLPITRIGDDVIDPQSLTNYRAMYPQRSGTACNGDPYATTAAPSRQHRGGGIDDGYRYANDIR
jgi:hypothetical protein